MNIPPESEVRIPTGDAFVVADLAAPATPQGLVIFAHGSGSSRHSSRNRRVAQAMRDCGFATLLADLLTPEEERRDIQTMEYRFDIERLARRVVDATLWAEAQGIGAQAIGYFGASTGSAAALVAASRMGDRVSAVVSRGGRPDLARDALPEVRAATLLIVGGDDREVIQLNRRAQARLTCAADLVIVPGAGHLFEEPGMLERVTALACDWFAHDLAIHAR
jgi:dienelactone hydrolase